MNAKVFISTTGKGLARAERGGDVGWSVETLLAGQDVRCLAVDPHHDKVVYAGTQWGGLLRSTDAGKTWSPSGLNGQAIKVIACSRSEPGVIYAGTKPPAIFVSRDDGQSWTELESFRQMRRRHWFTPAEDGDPYVMGLDVSPTDPKIIVAGIEYGAMLRSVDGGQTWHGHLKGSSRDCHSLRFHVTDGNWVYQGGGGWPAAVSRDAGATWKQPRRGMGWSLYGFACAADPERPEVWYVSAGPHMILPQIKMMPRAHWDGYSNSFIFRATPDGDGRWQRLGGGLPQPLDYMAYALLTDPTAPGHLYAGLSNGDIWHTADHGDTWEQLPVNLGGIHHSLVML
jgi:photosystem II stability/assembly factor-like uncharacterized protein